METLSLPLHPLLVHAAVTAIPVAAIAAICFVLVPSWRWALRWPTTVVSIIAAVTLFVTRQTGEQLAAAGEEGERLIEIHQQWANFLTVSTIGLVGLVLLAWWILPVQSPLASGRGAVAGRYAKFHLVLVVLVILAAVATIVFTVLTGHSGAVAVWTGE
ncbi:DUF2231 domain-containing protein [Gulosibacter bifidus]|uniref:DUF2231 domain-containing protein n=1 Tax=Gulosibacter bifidus TaxID=272239 RepID=A0ABW5RKB7_9MICO|nr:DUF2231 domain-containing protein [Gulosibacter bifidus]